MRFTIKDEIKMAEVKRVNEKISKQEMCNMMDISYNFYVNCVLGIGTPSQDLKDKLDKYMKMKTVDVHDYVYSEKKKEKYNKTLKITKEYEKQALKDIFGDG